MKKLLLLLSLSVLLVSCGSKYDKAISDREQTLLGTKIDLGLKIKSVKELETLTVADSVAYHKKEAKKIAKDAQESYVEAKNLFRKDSILYMSYPVVYESQIELQEEYLGRARDRFKKMSALCKEQLDYAKGYNKHWKKKYKGRDANEVLSVKVECTYSIKNPFLNDKRQELTKTYIMSVDGKACYGEIKDEATQKQIDALDESIKEIDDAIDAMNELGL